MKQINYDATVADRHMDELRSMGFKLDQADDPELGEGYSEFAAKARQIMWIAWAIVAVPLILGAAAIVLESTS